MKNLLQKYESIIQEVSENFERLPGSYKVIYKAEIQASINRRTNDSEEARRGFDESSSSHADAG